MFENSVSLLDACDIVFGHIFPFSPRAGTPAARMPQLDRAVIKARAEQLRSAAAQRKAAWLHAMIGSTQRALIELDGLSGHTDAFARISLAKALPQGNMRGTMIDVKISGADAHGLIGIPL
jgi:threonylcarbamoyladenosine tRNA methylthiotransferase MtaB